MAQVIEMRFQERYESTYHPVISLAAVNQATQGGGALTGVVLIWLYWNDWLSTPEGWTLYIVELYVLAYLWLTYLSVRDAEVRSFSQSVSTLAKYIDSASL